MAKKEIYLEEAVLDDLSQGLEIVEKPLSEKLFKVMGGVTLFLVFVFFLRLGYLVIYQGKEYQLRAFANSGQQVVVRAPRGIIYDRFGKILVTNQPSFDIVLNLSQILKDEGTLKQVLEEVSRVVPLEVEETKNLIASIDLERQAYFLLKKNVSLEQIIELKKKKIPSLIIENNFSRHYFEGEAFAHLLGYVGLVDKTDLAKNKKLNLNDEIGKSGLELYYDEFLRGQDGVSLVYKDAVSNVLEEKMINPPLAGKNLETTIDADLQQFFFETLKNQIQSLQAAAGGGLVMDPASGQILALVSFPSFDNNNLKKEFFIDKSRPLFNRIVSGVYSPGSTIKPLVAFAALEEGIVDPFFSIFSAGFIEIPNPYFPNQPSRFLDWKPHGWVNLYSALARSSNIYFYQVGGGFGSFKGLGIEKLREYWEKFLLNKKTGIDLPSEKSGLLPDPQQKEKNTGQIWRIGDTYNVAIGQGDLMITPLELLRYIAGISQRGKFPVPFIVKSLKNSSQEIIFSRDPKFEEISYKNQKNFEEVEKGMIDAVEKDYGTAHLLADLPLKIAAKTGSAQIENNKKVNAFFVGYNLPFSERECLNTPNQIAVLVLIEDAREGSLNAVPVAKKVFQWYYDNRLSQDSFCPQKSEKN